MLEIYSSVLPFWPIAKEKEPNFNQELQALKINMFLHSRRVITKLIKESSP
jgi:hypothetical protein